MAHMMHLVFVKEEHEVLSTSLSGEGRAAMVVALQELVKVRILQGFIQQQFGGEA